MGMTDKRYRNYIRILNHLKTVEERFWSHVNRNGQLKPGMRTRCWEWLLTPLPQGYGQFNIPSKGKPINEYSHRCAWQLNYGIIPPGCLIHHVCNNPICVNPHHLAVVPKEAHGDIHATLSFKATCCNGHPFDEVDPLIDGKGFRRCRVCALESRQRYNDKKSAG